MDVGLLCETDNSQMIGLSEYLPNVGEFEDEECDIPEEFTSNYHIMGADNNKAARDFGLTHSKRVNSNSLLLSNRPAPSNPKS